LGNDLFKSDKLDNGVWDLSAPEWGKTFVESVRTFGSLDLVESLDGTGWESTFFRGLHFDLEL